MFSRTTLAKLPIRVDCRKDRKVEAVHNLLEHRTTAKRTLLVGDLICSEAYSRKSLWA